MAEITKCYVSAGADVREADGWLNKPLKDVVEKLFSGTSHSIRDSMAVTAARRRRDSLFAAIETNLALATGAIEHQHQGHAGTNKRGRPQSPIEHFQLTKGKKDA